MTEKRDVRKTIYLDPGLVNWLEEHGRTHGRAFSTEVAFILSQYAKEQGYQQEGKEAKKEGTEAKRKEVHLSELIEILTQKGIDIVSCIV